MFGRLSRWRSIVSALGASMVVLLVVQGPVAGASDPLAIRLKALRSDLIALRSSIDLEFGYAFHFDSDLGKLVVETAAPVTDFAGVADKYADLIEIVPATVEVAAGRLADTSPFYGGASINDGAGLCSSGYVAKTATVTYMVTAGHCFLLNKKIFANRFASQGQVMGNVTKRDFPAYESELISGGTYSARIYSGANGDNTTSIPILGRKLDVKGTTGYCRSGQSSGASCSWKLEDTNATFCGDGWPGCADFMNAYSGGNKAIGGDSGGPIYKPYNNGALIAGTISGESCSILGCTHYGEKVGSILGKWSLSLVCSGTCVLQ